MFRGEDPRSIFESLPQVEAGYCKQTHTARLEVENRRIVTDLKLWADIYSVFIPEMKKYYDVMNSGGFLSSSEAASYRLWVEEFNIVRSMQISAELYAVSMASGSQVLVLGTGSGFDTAIPALHCPEKEFVATEMSSNACDNTNLLFTALDLHNARVINTDYQTYLSSIPDSGLAVVISNWTLSGSIDPIATISQVYQKLSSDGSVVITESRSKVIPEDIYDTNGIVRFVEKRIDGITPKLYFRSLAELLVSQGFFIQAASKSVPGTADTVIASKADTREEITGNSVLIATQEKLGKTVFMLKTLFGL